MTLSDKKCIPCEGGLTTPLSKEEISKLLSKTEGWQTDNESKFIIRNYKFKNFAKALAFVNKVGEIAESEGHHPDIEFGWGYAKIKLQTHSIGGLHENDFIIAAKINNITE
ncbi:MAG: putative pterin-4-alpha-carbinolamine dehydratase [Rickettsiaceae bacterium]|jgi:4a-hydroxytetrahydrobiopterin dehydratase|nr:putative pterin-4-alpha-carbinolamine dehydratase [Rickettsiaceae bacterium]